MNQHEISPESQPETPPEIRDLELEVAREIARASLTATSTLEVYRLALARVTPLVGATFASVFLEDEEPALFRLACAQNWPQSSARFLDRVRIRHGRGPTGRAVAEQQPVEVHDVFADPELEAWWEPARELGFRSMISLPLSADSRVFGALSFYFEETRSFRDDERTLLAIVAHQLAATAERAHLAGDMRSSTLRLDRENEALSRKMADAEEQLSDRSSGQGAGSR